MTTVINLHEINIRRKEQDHLTQESQQVPTKCACNATGYAYLALGLILQQTQPTWHVHIVLDFDCPIKHAIHKIHGPLHLTNRHVLELAIIVCTHICIRKCPAKVGEGHWDRKTSHLIQFTWENAVPVALIKGISDKLLKCDC